MLNAAAPSGIWKENGADISARAGAAGAAVHMRTPREQSMRVSGCVVCATGSHCALRVCASSSLLRRLHRCSGDRPRESGGARGCESPRCWRVRERCAGAAAALFRCAWNQSCACARRRSCCVTVSCCSVCRAAPAVCIDSNPALRCGRTAESAETTQCRHSGGDSGRSMQETEEGTARRTGTHARRRLTVSPVPSSAQSMHSTPQRVTRNGEGARRHRYVHAV